MTQKNGRSDGFAPEEKRLRMRMLELGVRQKDIAQDLGIATQDVSMVIRGRSKSPAYIAEVYKALELEMPEQITPA